VKNAPSVIAFVSALGLVVLTIGAVIRPAADLNQWHIVTMALAWVAVLSGALATRESPGETRAEDDRPDELENRRVDVPPAPATAASPHAWPGGSTALFEFARELHATLESDRLRLLISRRLPDLLRLRDVWIVARFGGGQQIIMPSSPGADAITMLSDEARQWATFPLKADGRTIGLLGAAVPAGGFTEQDHRLFKMVASLVAQALSTANTFESMREASLVDPLTGCATRAEGIRRLEAELRRAQRSRMSLAVLMLDLDHFKSINDQFGHKTGDAALTAVGEALLTALRASDVRCRWGGEEFLLVLPDSNVERAQRAAEKLRRQIARTPIGAGDRVVRVTASIGLTLSDLGETDMEQLLTRADTALYDAKRTGRNRISVVLPGTDLPAPAPAAPVAAPQLLEKPWAGAERRDVRRRDRRRVPSPGRRATDAVLAGRWHDR
jgi:diguanylate cyclase (GGDEF)-like protein